MRTPGQIVPASVAKTSLSPTRVGGCRERTPAVLRFCRGVLISAPSPVPAWLVRLEKTFHCLWSLFRVEKA